MGWVHDVPEDDLYDHEGYCAAVLGNGSEPEPVQVPTLGTDGTHPNSAWWLYDGQKGRPRAIAVRAGCACGWRSADMFPIDVENHEETEGFEFNDGPYRAWETQHISTLLGTAVPADVREAIAVLRRMLTGLAESRPLAAIAASSEVEKMASTNVQIAVTTARSRPGASWDAIGKALGMTRQAAHQRYAKLPFPG